MPTRIYGIYEGKINGDTNQPSTNHQIQCNLKMDRQIFAIINYSSSSNSKDALTDDQRYFCNQLSQLEFSPKYSDNCSCTSLHRFPFSRDSPSISLSLLVGFHFLHLAPISLQEKDLSFVARLCWFSHLLFLLFPPSHSLCLLCIKRIAHCLLGEFFLFQ